MSISLNGAHVPHRKNTAEVAPVRMPVPKTVTLLTSMHIGKPATAIVKPGDKVCVGQLIAEKNGPVSSPVHASISGTVKKIEDKLVSSGAYVQAITIESDGEMTVQEGLVPPEVNSYEEFVAALDNSGITGLGGAGFPTPTKLNVKDKSKIQEIIINSAECEPYITSDTRTMIDRTDDIEYGISLFEKFLPDVKIIIGIESNKKAAIVKMKEIAGKHNAVSVKVLPGIYPQGGEKVLIFNTTGKVVQSGKLPLDVGCIVINCTTMAEIARFMKTGIPLTEKCITVDGDAVKDPKNVIAPIGTSINDLFEFCGGFIKEPRKVLYGGPMMGIALPDGDNPVLKGTNAVLAFSEKMAKLPKETQCIHCGKCVNHCPFGLSPTEIAKAYSRKDGAELKKLEVNLCMECGCCSFVCPAKRPLVQTNKLAKAVLRDYLALEKARGQEAKDNGKA